MFNWTVKLTIEGSIYFLFLWNGYAMMKESKPYPKCCRSRHHIFSLFCFLLYIRKVLFDISKTRKITLTTTCWSVLIGWRRFGTIWASLKCSRMFRYWRHAWTLAAYVLESTVCVTSQVSNYMAVFISLPVRPTEYLHNIMIET